MLHGDAIREIMLEGPGAGGLETASAVVADMVERARDDGNRLPPGRRVLALAADAAARRSAGRRSTSRSRSTTGRACSHTSPSGSPSDEVSIAQLSQHQINGARPRHRHPRGALGRVADALADDRRAPETHGHPTALPVISDAASRPRLDLMPSRRALPRPAAGGD